MSERTPVVEQPLSGDVTATPWSGARARLENPERDRTYWLATVRPDGRPHVVPILGLWLDDAFYFVTGETTRKGKNLAGDPRCVIAASSTALPSLDVVLEGEARKVTAEPRSSALPTPTLPAWIGHWRCGTAASLARTHQPPARHPTRCTNSHRRPSSASPALPERSKGSGVLARSSQPVGDSRQPPSSDADPAEMSNSPPSWPARRVAAVPSASC